MDVPYLFCNYPNRHSTSCRTRKLPDRVVEGLQLYSARTFHVTLSPWIYKGGQGPPRKTSTPKAIQTTTQDVGYYATHGPNLSKLLCCLHHRVLDLDDFPQTSIYLRVSLGRCDSKTLTADAHHEADLRRSFDELDDFPRTSIYLRVSLDRRDSKTLTVDAHHGADLR